MDLAVLSLAALMAAIGLGTLKKVNVGVLSIGLAYAVGLAGGMDVNEITEGFSASMAITLIGVMYLFAVVNQNGTLHAMAKTITRLAGTRRSLLYAAMFLVGAVLSGVGPGTIPVLTMIPVLAIPVAWEAGMNPVLLSLIGQMGAQCGRMFPVIPEAVVVSQLMVQQGLNGSTMPAARGLWVTEAAMILFVFIYLKGWNIETPQNADRDRADHIIWTKDRLYSLIGLAAMLFCVTCLHMNVGFVSVLIGSALVLFHCSDEKEAIKSVSWSTILLVLGVGVMMNMVRHFGGIEFMANSIAGVSSPQSVSPIMCGTAGIMSFFVSGLGVVFPTLIPTVGQIAAGMPGITPEALMVSVVAGGTAAGFTPVSVAGAMIMAGVSQSSHGDQRYQEQNVFLQLCVISVGCLMISVLLAAFGVYSLVV